MNINIFVVFVVIIHESFQLDYECYFDGSIDITNPDKTKFKEFDLSVGGDNTDCNGKFTEDYSHVLLENCTVGEPIGIIFFMRRFGIMMRGNYAGLFRVQCHDVPPVDVLARIISNYLIAKNLSVPAKLQEIINASMIVTKMTHISQTSVYFDDLTFEWVLNVTVLDHILRMQEASIENTTSVPTEPGSTKETFENSTQQITGPATAESITTTETSSLGNSTMESFVGSNTPSVRTTLNPDDHSVSVSPTTVEDKTADETSSVVSTSTQSDGGNNVSDTAVTAEPSTAK